MAGRVKLSDEGVRQNKLYFTRNYYWGGGEYCLLRTLHLVNCKILSLPPLLISLIKNRDLDRYLSLFEMHGRQCDSMNLIFS